LGVWKKNAMTDGEQRAIKRLNELAILRNRYRSKQGAGTLSWPQPKIEVVDGKVKITPEMRRTASSLLVEEMMLLGGEVAARFAKEHNLTIPFRVQQPSGVPMLAPDADLVTKFGWLRKQQKATYQTTPNPHSSVGLSAYTKATSPLRRYFDYLVHSQIKNMLLGSSSKKVLQKEELEVVLKSLNVSLGEIENVQEQTNNFFVLIWMIWHTKVLQRPHFEAILLHQDPDEDASFWSKVIFPEIGFSTSVSLSTLLNPGETVKLRPLNINPYQSFLSVELVK
jgi:exoribonuclease-2